MAKAKKRKGATPANLRKAQKAAQSPAARAKRIATFKRNREAKLAQAKAEFTAAPLHKEDALGALTALRGAVDFPLHAIPARAPKAGTPARRAPAAPAMQPIVDTSETVQIVAGNFRITIERHKP